MTAKTPTAYWPVPSLIRSLSRAGWGILSGREHQGIRSTLRALADLLPDKSGMGAATAYQISETGGLSERWTRRCLAILEDMGIIEWTRGGVINGKPAPSYFVIAKTALVDLIARARETVQDARARHKAKTQERLATMKPGARVFSPRRAAWNRRSIHAELSASLSTPSGDLSKVPPNEAYESFIAKERAALRERELEENEENRRRLKDPAAYEQEKRSVIAEVMRKIRSK